MPTAAMGEVIMMDNGVLETLKRYLPLLIPVALLELGLMVAALLDLVKREQTRGPKWMWILIVVLVNIFGPIAYFLLGRQEE
jgi:hypothetical protein